MIEQALVRQFTDEEIGGIVAMCAITIICFVMTWCSLLRCHWWTKDVGKFVFNFGTVLAGLAGLVTFYGISSF
jgi:hypothetical protein